MGLSQVIVCVTPPPPPPRVGLDDYVSFQCGHVSHLWSGHAASVGVSVEALEQAAEKSGKGASSKPVTRSGTALIVKNLPYSAEEKELQVRLPAPAPFLMLPFIAGNSPSQRPVVCCTSPGA